MISFESDYTTGAHPEILRRLADTNMAALSGYGSDRFSESAISKIRECCGCPNGQVFFAMGGTQANQLVVSTMLKDYEGVLSADTGHINTHEAGAMEYGGHKVLILPSHVGKMNAEDLSTYLKNFYADGNHEHMVFPGMVYISHPTEYGGLYSKKELTDISLVCRSYHIPLYLDGARLAYGIAATGTDVDLRDIAEISDVFYIGGTKAGALCGEAIVFAKNNMPKHFAALAKQRGALLAKGRLLGIQFDTLFTDNLYYKNGKHAIAQKDKLVSILKKAGFRFYYESPTNQQFVIVENSFLKKLAEKVSVSFWERYDDQNTVVRFATSWSTPDEDISELEAVLKVL